MPNRVLRGVGFRGGDYTDASGLLPLTGAPAIEGSTANTTFESEAFFPQQVVTANYFGALGDSGRTSLILTPGQYRSDAPRRPHQHRACLPGMSLRLFYTGDSDTRHGDNKPAPGGGAGHQRGRPAPSGTGRSASRPGPRVTRRPASSRCGSPGPGPGATPATDVEVARPRAGPERLDPLDGTMPLPAGQTYEGVRFIVQAANGIGAVGLDTADGDGYGVTLEPDVALPTLDLDTQVPGGLAVRRHRAGTGPQRGAARGPVGRVHGDPCHYRPGDLHQRQQRLWQRGAQPARAPPSTPHTLTAPTSTTPMAR